MTDPQPETSQVPFTPVTAEALATLTPAERLAFTVASAKVAREQTGHAGTLTLSEFLAAVEAVDAHIDANTGPDYQAQPLARDWARVTKVCEEAGEVWKALSKMTGENPRKGKCGTVGELLDELGDTASAAICAIQHLTKDTDETWAVVSAALDKAVNRISEFADAPKPAALPSHLGEF